MTDSLSVLIALAHPHPGPGDRSTYTREIARLLAAAGHRADILALRPDGSGYYSPVTGAQHPSPRDVSRGMPPNADTHLVMADILQEIGRDFDLIHAMDPHAALAARQADATPVITTLHEPIALNEDDPWRLRLIERLGAGGSDRIIVPGERLAARVMERIPERCGERIHTVPYGLDIDAFDAELARAERPERATKRWVVLCTGQTLRREDRAPLIRAVRLLRRRRIPAELWLLTVPTGASAYRKLVKRLGAGRYVRLIRKATDPGSLLRAARVAVFPSPPETPSYPLIEAQLAGIPVVTTDAGAAAEGVRDQETGLVAPVGAPHALADRIESLYRSSDLYRQIEAAARKWAIEAWSGERLLAETVAVYRKALSEPSRGAASPPAGAHARDPEVVSYDSRDRVTRPKR